MGVTCADHEPGERPPVDVIAAGEMASLHLTGAAWSRALGECECDGPRLRVSASGVGLCLRLAERVDLERHYGA